MVVKESIKYLSQRSAANLSSEESSAVDRESLGRDSERANGQGDTVKTELTNEQANDEKGEEEKNEDKVRSGATNGIRIRGKSKETNESKTKEMEEKTIAEDVSNETYHTTITNKSIIIFQISLFLLYFIILLIGSCNFSFKLFQVKEKHVRQSVANIRIPTCKSSLEEKVNESKGLFKEREMKKDFFHEDSNNINIDERDEIDNTLLNKNLNKKEKNGNDGSTLENRNERYIHTFFKYYFTRTKHFLKKENKTHTHNGPIKIFICLNTNRNFYVNDIYNVFSIFRRYLVRFLSFLWNEVKGAFVKKKETDEFIEPFHNNGKIDSYIASHYLHYHDQLTKNKYAHINKSYVSIETLFYLYLQNICYLHDMDYIYEEHGEDGDRKWIQPFMYTDRKKYTLNWESKKSMIFLMNHINEYLNDETLLNVLNTLYVHICRNDSLWNYLNTENVCTAPTHNSRQTSQESIMKDKHRDCFIYHRYYTLYNMIEHFREVNRYTIFMNIIRKKLHTLRVLNKADNCTKRYILNLKNIPLYFFLNIFYDTPCYVYNKIITNLLRNYYKGLFLYFIIFIGCIHVFFSPFPITLVHFRRFFIYFLIIMYRLFIFYFIPSIIQYIFYKFNNFEEEYKHIFDYSDHVILFSTLLFIISLETQAIKYTINHQKQGFDNFHYKYNRKLCFFFLKLVLYYYYVLMFFFLYTSYFTSKYFHTPNEIFVAYFFSTFSIFVLFYFFLYKGYFSFYSLGITSFVRKESNVSAVLFPTPILSNTNSVISLKEKFSLD